jgi:hypothetical protein
MELLGMASIEDLPRSDIGCVEEALACPEQVRESKWTESIAVGSRDFVDVTKRGLGVKAPRERPKRMIDISRGCLPRYAKYIAKGCPGEHLTKRSFSVVNKSVIRGGRAPDFRHVDDESALREPETGLELPF